MGEIVHIFGKDLRRLAAPVLALVAIETLVAYSEVHAYPIVRERLWPYSVSQSLFLLLPFAWIFLIAALVLQEQLPGTRQYWLARPIRWSRLLAAKLLFAAIFVNALWFLSDNVILLALHLPIHPLDLLLRQIPLTSVLFLPAFCLASITSGLGQIALGLIAAAVGFLLEVLVPTIFLSHRANSKVYVIGNGNLLGHWPWIVLPVLTLFIIVFQFARRDTWRHILEGWGKTHIGSSSKLIHSTLRAQKSDYVLDLDMSGRGSSSAPIPLFTSLDVWVFADKAIFKTPLGKPNLVLIPEVGLCRVLVSEIACWSGPERAVDVSVQINEGEPFFAFLESDLFSNEDSGRYRQLWWGFTPIEKLPIKPTEGMTLAEGMDLTFFHRDFIGRFPLVLAEKEYRIYNTQHKFEFKDIKILPP